MLNKWDNPLFLKIYNKWKAVRQRALQNQKLGKPLTAKMQQTIERNILSLAQDEFTEEMKGQHKLLNPIPSIYMPPKTETKPLKIRGDDYSTYRYLKNMFREDREGKPPSRYIESLWKEESEEDIK